MSEHVRLDVKVVSRSCYNSLEEIDNFRVDTTFFRALNVAECYVSLKESRQQACPQGVVVVVVVAAVVPRV